ncbi:PLP-dependent aminotransferase family protein [Vagococcus zengguangii]|uniref:aminotransferase-like domain-containing protein n=1 Tax=Vagococcus zengguangii TaxID=2571750 RepID=UPI001109AC0A|nr:PLP-dependent aminotransferase family protein [Vagococcus zengguangii]TLG80268.1 PLP-dependent aminotransferase family protein [Vagococcus zengguangii]
MFGKLDRTLNQPLYQQLMILIKEKIQMGELVAGDRLPSERQLSELLEVNRSTVIRAYDELAVEGVLTRKRGSGTLVSRETWLQTPRQLNWKKYLAVNEQVTTPATHYKKQLQDKVQLNPSSIIDGYTGDLPQQMIPSFNLTEMKWHDFLVASSDQEPFGLLSLRQALSNYIDQQFGYQMKLEELLLTAGGQQSLFFIMNALLQSGDTVAVEAPSYFYSLPMFDNYGIRTETIPLDSEGINLNYFEALLEHQAIKMLFVTPNYQNPTTITMSLERKKALVALCERHQIIIVEDDVYGLLGYQNQQLPLLKSLSPDNVLYVGSLSKVLGKTIQLGWINAPSRVLEVLIKVREEWEQPLSIFPQMLVSQLMAAPEFSLLVAKLRQELFQKVCTLYQLVISELANQFSVTLPSGGYYLWLTYQGRLLTINDWQFLLEQNILVFPSFLLTEHAQSIRINVANLSEEQMKTLVKALKNHFE